MGQVCVCASILLYCHSMLAISLMLTRYPHQANVLNRVGHIMSLQSTDE